VRLDLVPAVDHPELLAPPVAGAVTAAMQVAPIDPTLADTAAFCAAYDVGLDISANCVIVAGTRGEVTRYAACMVLATTRLDVNGVVRRLLDARKASFAPMDDAVALSGMEYGGITPVGLPDPWRLFVDEACLEIEATVIGSGVRRSKLLVPGRLLGDLPRAEVLAGLGLPQT
jgi:prolyl-tRNA editing enzyme YbaK/EbsC (Cys-tRNA(Pro) deacylase)